VNALGVLVPDNFASASVYTKLSPDSQVLSDCDAVTHSPVALLALPVAGRAVYAIRSSSLSPESSSIEVEQLDVFVGDDIENDDDLAERQLVDDDIGDTNSDIYIDDDDDVGDIASLEGVTTAADDDDNNNAGFSLARLAADHARNSPAAQRRSDDNDDDDASSEGPSRVFKAPKSALIALLNSVSAAAPSTTYDGRVGELRESDIAYLEQYQAQSAVVSKILLSSAKLPPVKSTQRLPPSASHQLRQAYSVQAPPISIDSRVVPSHYQEIPPLAKRPPLPAKLSRQEYADLSGDSIATSKMFAPKSVEARTVSGSPAAPAKWRACWPTTIVVLCLKCCEPTAVRPRPRVLSRALAHHAKSIPCGSCKSSIIPPLLPPPTCDECRLRRPATRVRTSGANGGNDTVVWLCRRCCARVERLLATVVEDLPTLADNSLDQFASTGAQHAIFQADMVTEILLKRAIEPPGFHRTNHVLSRASTRDPARKAAQPALARASSIL
jgi:hypothetical protein